MPSVCSSTVGSDGRKPESIANGVVDLVNDLTRSDGMCDTRSFVEVASASGVQVTR